VGPDHYTAADGTRRLGVLERRVDLGRLCSLPAAPLEEGEGDRLLAMAIVPFAAIASDTLPHTFQNGTVADAT
jgi:hypothetical protein